MRAAGHLAVEAEASAPAAAHDTARTDTTRLATKERAPVADRPLRTPPFAFGRLPVTQPGQPLAERTRELMGSGFGHDFRDVRVHADAAAARSARDLSAAAYTVGNHIVFGAGRYQPETVSGRELLAHELAHTVQQRAATGAPPSPARAGIVETSARSAGRAVANGQPVTAALPSTGIGLSRSPLYAAESERAQDVLGEGKVWVEQHYLNALLTEAKPTDRAKRLAYSRALVDVDIEMSKRQKAHQQFAPVLDDVTERRIGYRRNALAEIVRTRSVREGLDSAEDRAGDADEREQIRLVRNDMKQVQDEFRDRAYDNAYKLLDSSSREIASMLQSYGLQMARAEDVVHFVRIYEGEREPEAAKWVATARASGTSGFADPRKAQHRKDLSATLKHLRTLQYWVKRLKPPKDPVSSAASLVVGPLADLGPKTPDSPELKHAKAELAVAWMNAEREHPVLAAYRAGKDDKLEEADLGGGGGEGKDEQAVVSQAIRLLVNILTAKLALQQKKVSPFELAPIVALTRAQMLIRRGSVWDIAIQEMMRGDDDGEEWAKEALKTALSAIILVFPFAWPLMIVSAGINLHAAGTEYVRYGLDQALIATNLDRAKALSSKEPSLAGFAWALVGAGLDVVGARAAYKQAQSLRAAVLAGDENAVAALDRLGEAHGVPHLGEDIAKTRPATTPTAKPEPPVARAPVTEESFGSKPSRTSSRALDRGKGARPFYKRDPVTRPAPRPKPSATAARSIPTPASVPTSGQELVARAEAMLERLPAKHPARNQLAQFIEDAHQRLGRIRLRTQAAAEPALSELSADLERIRARYPGAFEPRAPAAKPPVRPTTAGAGTASSAPGFRDRVLVGAVDESGRATHVTGELHPSDLHTGTPTGDYYPPGAGRGELHRARRGHLLADLFGGRGSQPGNLMWLDYWVNNSPYKTEFEHLVADALRSGENVRFTIVPHFRDARAAAPYAVEVWAETTAGKIVVSHRSIPTPGLSDLRLPRVAR
jgi:hypothetical protein